MADINKELLKALDGPAPQHKVSGEEVFEFSEGSDGALHTKIVDHLGNPISSENKLQVADADVKAELELIKQQQQQILERLNEPIPTQVTGSLIGKEVLFEETDLPQNAFILTPILSAKEAKRIGFIVITDVSNANVNAFICDEFNTQLTRVPLELKGVTRSKRASIETISENYRFRVDSNHDADIKITAVAYYYA